MPSFVLSFHSYLWPPLPLGALWPCCFVPALNVPPLWWPPTLSSNGFGTFLWPFDAFVGLTSAAGIVAARDEAVAAPVESLGATSSRWLRGALRLEATDVARCAATA